MRLERMLAERASSLKDKIFAFDSLSNCTLSYTECLSMSIRVSHDLVSRGVMQGDCVAIFLPNRLEYYPSLFGIFGVGAIAVPLNPSLSLSELKFFLSFTGSKVLIADKEHSPDAGWLKQNVPSLKDLILLDHWDLLSPCKESFFPFAHGSDEDIALILFTSGSAEDPKGVMHSHRTLFSNCKTAFEWFHFSEEDRALNGLPLFTIFGLQGTSLIPIFAGGSIILHTVWNPFTVNKIWKIAADFKATFLTIVPALITMLLKFSKPGRDIAPRTVRFVISGGAPLFANLHEQFETSFGIPLVNGYGMTEMSPIALSSPVASPRKYGSVGRPVDCALRIVDDDGNSLPVGLPGEIIVSSSRIMIGYYGNEKGTKNALRDGWFHTGDIGYIDSDGDLFLSGRKKEMAICNGLKVYLPEVDEALSSHPKILEAITVEKPGALGESELHAFIVPVPGAQLLVTEVREHAALHLASYKCPRYISIVSELPRSKSGKILRRMLEQREPVS